MSLDLWYKSDVARILQSADNAMASTAEMLEAELGKSERTDGYKQGFEAALRAVAVAFGISNYADFPHRADYAFLPNMTVI